MAMRFPAHSSTHPAAALVASAFVLMLATVAQAAPGGSTVKRVLFDNTHAETAGNADWVIDSDQPFPVPAQSTVTAATPRTYWLGAISSWAIDLVKRGYEVATVTSAYGITYGNPTNPFDLSTADVFIVPEPNTVFTSAESIAIFDYVRDGGGLIAVADHINSDRNNDGWDSPEIWNKLDAQLLWGVRFETSGANSNFSEVWSTNVSTALDDSVVYGPEGTVNGLEFHGGTTMTLYPGFNPTVRGCVWRNGMAQASTGAMAARSVYGDGRIFFIGDSSPVDDGSAQPGNNNIFDGWAEAAGGDSLLMLNATAWVTRRDAAVLGVAPGVAPTRGPFPNPFREDLRMTLRVDAPAHVRVDVLDVGGRVVARVLEGNAPSAVHEIAWDGRAADGRKVAAGLYFVRARIGETQRTWRVARVH